MGQTYPEVYAVRHIDENTRLTSQSGGAFAAISDHVLENEGIVYGCVLDENLQAVHVRAADKASRDRMRGSKYIQSRLNDTFKAAKADLQAGKQVLFSGTPCQIAGLRKFMGKEYDNLFCVDLVCHGVPSPAVWQRYLEWRQAQTGQRAQQADFRNKKAYGWHEHYETIQFNAGKKIGSNVFANIFYSHMALRPCCYTCPFKKALHPGDITIGDYWGVEKTAPEFDDNMGVSLVLINNNKGANLFAKIEERVYWKQTRLEDSMQRPLIAPFPRPENRDRFWAELAAQDFAFIARKYGKDSFKAKVREKLMYLKTRGIKIKHI